MSIRNISAEGLRDLFDQHTGSAMFALVSFYEPNGTMYARVVNNTENITHNGAEYIGLPFELTLPNSSDEQIPQLTLKVSNVDRTLVELLRGVEEPPNVAIEVVRVTLAGNVTTELGPMDMSLLSADISAASVSLTIGYQDDILNSPATGDIFNPGTSPALFTSGIAA